MVICFSTVVFALFFMLGLIDHVVSEYHSLFLNLLLFLYFVFFSNKSNNCEVECRHPSTWSSEEDLEILILDLSYWSSENYFLFRCSSIDKMDLKVIPFILVVVIIAFILWLQNFLFCLVLFPASTNEFWTCSYIIYHWSSWFCLCREEMEGWCRFGKQWIGTLWKFRFYCLRWLCSLLLLFTDKLVDWEYLLLYDRHYKSASDISFSNGVL